MRLHCGVEGGDFTLLLFQPRSSASLSLDPVSIDVRASAGKARGVDRDEGLKVSGCSLSVAGLCWLLFSDPSHLVERKACSSSRIYMSVLKSRSCLAVRFVEGSRAAMMMVVGCKREGLERLDFDEIGLIEVRVVASMRKDNGVVRSGQGVLLSRDVCSVAVVREMCLTE